MAEEFDYGELDDADEAAFQIHEQAEFAWKALGDAAKYAKDQEGDLEKVVGRGPVDGIWKDLAAAEKLVGRILKDLLELRQDFEARMLALSAEDLNDDVDGVAYGFGNPGWM